MRNSDKIRLLETRLNRLERNDRNNYGVCRKIRREIEILKEKAQDQES